MRGGMRSLVGSDVVRISGLFVFISFMLFSIYPAQAYELLFFDDFDYSSLSDMTDAGWTIVGDSSGAYVGNSVVGTYFTGGNGPAIKRSFDLPSKFILEVKARSPTNSRLSFGFSTLESEVIVWIDDNPDEGWLTLGIGGKWPGNECYKGPELLTDLRNFQIYRIVVEDGNIEVYKNDVLIGSSYLASVSMGGTFIFSFPTFWNTNQEFDYIKIYTQEEQTPPTPSPSPVTPPNVVIYSINQPSQVYVDETFQTTITLRNYEDYDVTVKLVGISSATGKFLESYVTVSGDSYYYFQETSKCLTPGTRTLTYQLYWENELIDQRTVTLTAIQPPASTPTPTPTPTPTLTPTPTPTTPSTTTPSKSTLKIYSAPSRASVYIDGSYKGTTPLTLYLSPGSYTVKLKKSGYEDYVKNVYLSSGETETLDVYLTKIVATTTTATTTTTAPTTPKQSQSNLLYILPLLLLILIVPAAVYKKRSGDPSSRSPPSSKPASKPPTPPTPPTSAPQQIPAVKNFPQELLTKYQPLEYLGEGGFAKVFKVKRLNDGKTIALKIPNLDEKARKFFLKEVRAWSQLNHPNIVKLFNAFDSPIPHLEMEFVDGAEIDGKIIRDLGQYPKPVDDDVAIQLITKIAQGLKHAHSKQIYHRDLKPNNILLKSDLTPKITDWGLAKIGAMTTTATTTKGLTLLYAAPEQLDDEMYGHTDARTDVYQLGLVLYELLTDKLPYEGSSTAVIMAKIINPDVKPKLPSAHNEKLSKYDNFFEKVLAKRKEDRYQSVDEFVQALNEIEKLDKERRKLKESIAKTKTTMSLTTSSEELRKLTREVVRQLCKNALINAKLNDKAELIIALEELKAFSKKHKDELQKLIERVEFMVRERIPVGEELIDVLKVVLSRVENEMKETG